VRRAEGDEIKSSSTAVVAVQFSDEYKRNISNENLVNFIGQSGRILEDDDNVFTKLSGKQSNRRSITFFLIVCSIILLLVDIVFRRFAIGEIVKRLIKKNSSERKKKPAAIKVDYSENSDIIPEADEAITETPKNEVNKVEAEKRKENKKEKKKDKPVEETLDTSALLKKKKDRNL
jgi:hypothetical protein